MKSNLGKCKFIINPSIDVRTAYSIGNIYINITAFKGGFITSEIMVEDINIGITVTVKLTIILLLNISIGLTGIDFIIHKFLPSNDIDACVVTLSDTNNEITNGITDDTILDNVGISHLGTYKSAEDQDKILIKDVKGVKIAFINYTYGTNGIPVPSDKPYCLNLIDKDLISKQIKQAKEQNVDMIVACMHWGTEYKTSANDEQKELADFLFKSGVDIILGNHPHVLEPMEKKTITLDDGSTKDVFVVYALGNFTADQRAEITRDSAILNLDITKDSDGKILINKVSYVPIYMYKNSAAKVHKFKILDIEKSIANYDSGDTSIGSSVYSNLKVQLQKIRDILGDEIN